MISTLMITCIIVTHTTLVPFKIFTDASYDCDTHECGAGVVLYNVSGECTGFNGTYAAGVVDTEAGECMAILEGLRWVQAMELDNIHIIVDVEVVV